MVVGASQKKCDGSTSSMDPKLIFKILKSIEWVYGDPILRYKLRELAFRWVEASELVSVNTDSEFEYFALDDSRESSTDTKRIRSDSCESIVDIKPEHLSESSSQSTPSTPEVDSNPTVSPETNAAPVGDWECRKCTFMNSEDAKTSCAICGWFKSRSVEATGTVVSNLKPVKKDLQVLAYIQKRNEKVSTSLETTYELQKPEDMYGSILSRGIAGTREQGLTGPLVIPQASRQNTCTIFTSPFNLVSCGQAQEESTWIDSLEKDLFAQHSLDEELIFRKRYIASIEAACKAEATLNPIITPSTVCSPESLVDEEEEEAKALLLSKTVYAQICNGILTGNFPSIPAVEKHASLSWSDWIRSGVHTAEYLKRLLVIHSELVNESRRHFAPFKNIFSAGIEAFAKIPEAIGRQVVDALFNEPKCDLSLHLLSHVEGDNVMDRFLIPAAIERGDLVYSGLVKVWESSDNRTTAFIAARPPGHHCPSFEDRLVGLSVYGVESSTRNRPIPEDHASRSLTRLERQICDANGLFCPPKECGMGFCSLNALSVAVKTFQKNYNPSFESNHGRSIRIAIVDLDIHAGNGTELVFRDSRSVLHISVHRYGWLKSEAASGGHGSVIERLMPGTHPYKDTGGILGKDCRHPRGEGYAVNVNLRKADGNAEVMSSFEAVVIPIMQQFAPDMVVVACGFDGLKLSPAFKQRWGEESCPGMDAEYTPSLYGYLIGRIRSEVQSKMIAVTEGGYDPIGVGLAARSVVKGLKGNVEILKPPMRVFNNDWLVQLNNIWQLQQKYWSILRN